MAADTGNQTTIVFGTSAFAAGIIGFTAPTADRESIETSLLVTVDDHTYMPGDLVDNGEMNLNIEFDPLIEPPMNGATETITITWPLGDTWVFQGFMTSAGGANVNNDARMEASVNVKVAGPIAVTDVP